MPRNQRCLSLSQPPLFCTSNYVFLWSSATDYLISFMFVCTCELLVYICPCVRVRFSPVQIVCTIKYLQLSQPCAFATSKQHLTRSSCLFLRKTGAQVSRWCANILVCIYTHANVESRGAVRDHITKYLNRSTETTPVRCRKINVA